MSEITAAEMPFVRCENSVFNNPIFPARKGIPCLQHRDHNMINGIEAKGALRKRPDEHH